MTPANLDFRERKWGSADGRLIKVKDLEIGHLVNILNWILDNPLGYDIGVYHLMVKEAEYRRLVQFAGNGPWPEFVESRWVLKDPVTGSGFLTPPPQEYIDKLIEMQKDKI